VRSFEQHFVVPDQRGSTSLAQLRTFTHWLYRQQMDGPFAPLVVGILVAGRTIFVLFSGSASADNKGLLRKEQPMTYWLIIAIGLVGSIVLFATAYHLRNGSQPLPLRPFRFRPRSDVMGLHGACSRAGPRSGSPYDGETQPANDVRRFRHRDYNGRERLHRFPKRIHSVSIRNG